VTDALFDIGVTAVVGMQGDVADEFAALFASTFYLKLADGKPVDVAVAEARRLAGAKNQSYSSFDAAMPALTCVAIPDSVLPTHDVNPPRELEAFVDRSVERREFRKSVDPIRQRNALTGSSVLGVPGSLLVVHGPKGAGKSGLVQWCLQHCYARDKNRIVRYVDLSRDVVAPGKKNFLDVLRHIRDGEQRPLRAGLPEEAFWRFNMELNALLANHPLPPPGLVEPTPDRGLRLPAESPIENLVAHIFQSFRAALVKAAGGHPLIIALDHLEAGAVPEFFRKQVREHLLQPVADDPNGIIRIIIVASNAEMQTHGIADLTGRQNIELQMFGADQFYELAMDYCSQNRLDETKAETMVKAIRELHIKQSWSPSVFPIVRKYVTGVEIV
jgi:hypothetical protein